jgi:hypothetical protein
VGTGRHYQKKSPHTDVPVLSCTRIQRKASVSAWASAFKATMLRGPATRRLSGYTHQFQPRGVRSVPTVGAVPGRLHSSVCAGQQGASTGGRGAQSWAPQTHNNATVLGAPHRA